MKIIALLCYCIFTVQSLAATNEIGFKKARPVWVTEREREMNLTINFTASLDVDDPKDTYLSITGSTLYRVYVNGEFAGYGPARAAHGYFRVDEYDISGLLSRGTNKIAIEVVGYNVNTYYTLDQPSFLQAEVKCRDRVVLYTDVEGDFIARQDSERLQRVERYSFQRPFTEYYRMDSKPRVNPLLKLSVCDDVKLLPRAIRMPDYRITPPQKLYAQGVAEFRTPDTYASDRSLLSIGDKFKGFKMEDLELIPSKVIQDYATVAQNIHNTTYGPEPIRLNKNEFVTYDMGTNLTGFINTKISCTEACTIYLYFDEILTDGDVNTRKRQADINNTVVYELKPGEYDMETFESYTFKYLKLIVLDGSCTLRNLYMREYAYPENNDAYFMCSNLKLNAIFDAARQSFRQNAVDLLSDCPSREKAGWLCDSYFSAIVEKDLTGRSDVARNFYENYALPEKFEFLPEGMIPMCYPADHNDGVFIPNWSLWFILQIHDFAQRNNDTALIKQLKPRVEKLLKYFEGFENSDGLLENLESWIFVEWSQANNFVDGVNYPTNMLYSRALTCASELYGNTKWSEKAEKIKCKIIEQAYDGQFFIDNAMPDQDGVLKITKNKTEACQYYAFYFDIVNPNTHGELWQKLVTEFGPKRDVKSVHPTVFAANAFVGNYMRMDLLSRYNLKNQMIAEMQDFFYAMAQKTGTLWEHMGTQASCNHGFASYLAHIIYRDVLGVTNIDYRKKVITISVPQIDVDECSGAIPIGDEKIELKWNRSKAGVEYTAPKGYQVIVESNE